ncbi:MAG: OmpA family protein [Longimicrobiales bacterium]
MRSHVAPLTLLATLLAAPVSAQDAGTVEIGMFGRMSSFDNTNPISDVPALGLGGRLGLFVLPNLELEATGSYSDSRLGRTQSDVNYMPFRGLAVLNLPLGDRLVPILGAGVSHSRYSGAINASNTGPAGILGFKAYYGERTMIRTEATLDHFGTPFNWPAGVDRHLNWGWQLGVSFATSRPSRDTDADGVRDRDDRCVMTPAGERVDEAGCPFDTDRDGVIDSRDKCAGTKVGAPIDAAGCALDADKDGVYDNEDRCANTPRGADVDSRGCPTDRDGDGIPNSLDRCSSTPAGVGVDATGCAADTDRDGVADHLDRCSDTQAGARVDGRGCARDGDSDGVADGIDLCALTDPGVTVDARGCPILFDEEEEEAVLVLDGVTFSLGSDNLTGPALAVLDRVAESLVANPEVHVEVAGHTDNSGSRALNLSLSQERAEAVARYLSAKGVLPSALTAKGYGPDEPAASNENAAGRKLNRRVELKRVN